MSVAGDTRVWNIELEALDVSQWRQRFLMTDVHCGVIGVTVYYSRYAYDVETETVIGVTVHYSRYAYDIETGVRSSLRPYDSVSHSYSSRCTWQ